MKNLIYATPAVKGLNAKPQAETKFPWFFSSYLLCDNHYHNDIRHDECVWQSVIWRRYRWCRHDTLSQSWFKAGPASQTVTQNWTNIGWTFPVDPCYSSLEVPQRQSNARPPSKTMAHHWADVGEMFPDISGTHSAHAPLADNDNIITRLALRQNTQTVSAIPEYSVNKPPTETRRCSNVPPTPVSWLGKLSCSEAGW